MLDLTPRIRVPASASPGEAVRVRATINHPMHTGFVPGPDGELIARHIIERFVCTFNDEVVIDIALDTGVSANPFFDFEATVPEAGVFEFSWHDQDGTVYSESARIEVG